MPCAAIACAAHRHPGIGQLIVCCLTLSNCLINVHLHTMEWTACSCVVTSAHVLCRCCRMPTPSRLTRCCLQMGVRGTLWVSSPWCAFSPAHAPMACTRKVYITNVLSPTQACKCNSSRPLAAQAEALQRLGCRDTVLSSELDTFRKVIKVNWSLMCFAQPVEMTNVVTHSHTSLQLPQEGCRTKSDALL